MTMILPTINVVARPCGLPPNWFVASNSGDTYLISPVNTLVKDPSGCARESYDIDTGNFLGFLIESASTNLLGNSNRALTTANSWTISGGTVTTPSGMGLTDPDSVNGTNICSLVTPSASPMSLTVTKTGTAAPVGKYTISAYFRLATSTPATVKYTIGSTASTVTHNITSTNWSRRFSGITIPLALLPLTAKLEITGGSVYVDYIQVEKGNLTSPIPGNNGTYTRSYDSIGTVSPNPFGSLINPDRGTFYMQYNLGDNTLRIPNSVYCVFSAVGIGYALTVLHITSVDGTTDAIAVRCIDSTERYSLVTVPNSTTGDFKIALAYNYNSVPRISINGANVSSLAYTSARLGGTATPPTLNIGNYSGTIAAISQTVSSKSFSTASVANPGLDGHLNHFAYFPSVLSDTDLVTLTTL